MGIFVSALQFLYSTASHSPQDVDRSGTINFNGTCHTLLISINLIRITEFAGLWKYISDWQNVFRHFDQDRSGSIEGRELADALRSFGYTLSPHLLSLIERKYGGSSFVSARFKHTKDTSASAPSTGYGPPPGITFDRFVRACVVVKTLTESFQRLVSFVLNLVT